MVSESSVSASAAVNGGSGSSSSRARELAMSHFATVEDVPDDDLVGVPNDTEIPAQGDNPKARPAGKQRPLDTHSRELFPELSAPKPTGAGGSPGIWGPKANGGTTPTNGISPSPTPGPASGPGGHAAPAAAGPQGPGQGPGQAQTQGQGPTPMVTIPGRNVETVSLEPQHILPRAQLRRPIPDIIKDINRKSRANIAMVPTTGGRLRFDATGPPEIAQQALRDLVQQIGTKVTIKVPIPSSARAHIIGRAGSTIKAIQEKTGAKIQLPKLEEGGASAGPDDDDDQVTINVVVEGNTVSAASARNEILKIAAERTATLQTKLRGIPSEFYPFIAGPRNARAHALEEDSGVQIRVPPLQARSTRPAPSKPADGRRPIFSPVPDDNHIQLAGDRAAVQQARAEIERLVADLHNQLDMEQAAIQRGRHQFIIGDRGIPMDDFFAETGCAILLPADGDDDMVTVIGPADRVQSGLERAMDLAMNMQCTNIDIGRFHRNAPGGAAVHARNVTRYLRHQREIDRIEKLYSTQINTPFSRDGALPWELYSRDGRDAIRAQSEITSIINGHPPSRMTSIPVDPFFHQHLRNDITPRVREQFGVQVVVPAAAERDQAVLLVYEGLESAGEPYQIPRSHPTPQEVQAFARGLEDAQNHILELINKQEQITNATIDVPQKFHEKLRKFIKNEQQQQQKQATDAIPIRVSSLGTNVTLRGPASAVDSLAIKVNAFIEQEKQDEKERDYTTSFDFPQKYTNHLVGKGGSHIKELRERFDVEIQARDGRVELKGPKTKADAARSHILSWGRALADETTHIMKIDPKFHRELIGPQRNQITRLQDRYKVLIFFPRVAPKNGGAADDHQSNADGSSESGGGAGAGGAKPRRQQAADEVMIRGPKQGADNARDEIFSLYNFIKDNSYMATVTMQQKHVPLLIGQGGMALDDIRQTTGARIDVPGNRDSEMVDIQIKGTKAEVEAAKKALEARRAVFGDTVVKEIEVERKHHKALIGPNGSTLRAIVTDAGGSDDRREMARAIQFPKQESDGNIIKLEGRSGVVEKMLARIQEIVAERESQVTEVIEVPIEKHRTLIGRGGEAKRQLESQLGVAINIPRQGDGNTGVQLVGRPENVEKAKEHILGLVKGQAGETVMVPRRLHLSISNNGQFFRRLRGDFHVSVDHAGHGVPQKQQQSQQPPSALPNGSSLPLITDDPTAADAAEVHSWHVVESSSTEEGDIPWVLRGSSENVDRAKKAIQSALEQADKNSGSVGYLVLPDPKTYRHVIGSGGSRVNAIRKQSGCRINVPREQTKEEAIEIIGSREGVQKAKELVLAAVREGVAQGSPARRSGE